MSRRSTSGFSLIELLVVIAIIAVLSTIGVVSFQSIGQRSRDGKRRADLTQVRAALELYKSQNNTYPPQGNYNGMVQALGNAQFLSNPLPSDPKPSPYEQYAYRQVSATTYCLCARLEATGTGNSSSSACAGTSGNYYCVVQP